MEEPSIEDSITVIEGIAPYYESFHQVEVPLPAVQDLDYTLQLPLPADELIQLALLGPLGQGDAVAVQKLPLGGLGLPLLATAGGRGGALAGAGGGGGTFPERSVFTMQPTMCSRCGKNVAVIFITKLEGGTSKNEGLPRRRRRRTSSRW